MDGTDLLVNYVKTRELEILSSSPRFPMFDLIIYVYGSDMLMCELVLVNPVRVHVRIEENYTEIR